MSFEETMRIIVREEMYNVMKENVIKTTPETIMPKSITLTEAAEALGYAHTQSVRDQMKKNGIKRSGRGISWTDLQMLKPKQ